MADPYKALPANVSGNFFVDSTCIECDTYRQLAPTTFVEKGNYSAVALKSGAFQFIIRNVFGVQNGEDFTGGR
jgi:hypothetical protein